MGAEYTRQSTFTDGDIITAAHSNDEFNKLLAAFASSTGHTHDGTTAEGGPITKLLGNALTFGTGADTDIAITFDGNTSDGTLTWMEDEAHFKFSDDIVIDSTKKLYLNDEGGEHISGDGTDLTITSGNDLNLTATTDINIPANVGLTFGNDAEKIEGDGTDLTVSGNNINLTAVADVNIPSGVGLTFATAEKIESDGTDLTITVGSGGDINIPANIGMTFGDDGEKIEGDGTDLTITGNNINLTATADIIVPANVGITFGTGEKIEGDSTDLTVTSGAKINLTATSDVHIPNNVGIVFGGDSEKIEGDGTDMTISANNLTVDAVADIILDANGANVIFKDDGTSILDIANNSGDAELTVSTADKNFAIKGTDGSSAITALDIDMALAGKATFSGDVVVTGDLTITGDDLTMGTNTAGHILVGDDTNFNPVEVGGDVTMNSSGVVTIANGAVETAMVNANVITGQTAETSLDTSNDTILIHDASASALRKVTLASLSSGLGGLSDISGDSTPQLGGDLDTNSFNIKIDDAHGIQDDSGNELIVFQKTASAVNQFDVTNAATGNAPELSATGGDTNISLKITPKGSGQVVLDGNVGIESGVIDLKNAGSQSYIRFYCESSNQHYVQVQAPAHSAFSDDQTITLPATTDTLVGRTTTDTLTNKTLTTPTLTTPIANAGVQLKNGATSAGFLEFFEDSDNGTNKVTLIGPASTADVTLTLPSATDTIVGKATTDTLTNKSIDSDNNTITNIVNADIKSSAAIADTKLDTISTANKVALTALDIDGGSDIGADLTTSDLIVVDDGAGGTNKKAALSRLTTFMTAQGFSSDDPTALAIALG